MAEFDFEKVHSKRYSHRVEAETANIKPGGIGIELGVMRGNHAASLLETAKPKKLYLIDPWKGIDARYKNVLNKFKDDPRVVVMRCSAEEALSKIKGKVDWIVHDTAQLWPSAYTDLAFCDKKLKVGGLLFFDYCYKERKICFEKFMKDVKVYKVVSIIDYTDSVVVRKTDTKVLWPARTDMKKSLCKSGSVGAEIGVLNGNHAEEILKMVRPSKLLLVDVWDGNLINYIAMKKMLSMERRDILGMTQEEVGDKLFRHVENRFRSEIDNGQVEAIRSKSVDAARDIEDDSLDWVYIDAAHDYDNVIADLEAYYSKVKTGGLILGHDYTYRVKNGGAIRAVDAFLERHPSVEFIGISDERPAPSFALRKN